MMRLILASVCLLLCSGLSGCSYLVSFSPGRLIGPEENEKLFKVGKPYQVAGKWYYPKDDLDYNKVGYASWYGPDFHGNDTANGETFNKYALTAAHKTLPMPSIVKVTNLENGRWVKVRINDRGPFVEGRIIDVSKEAAKKLGFMEKGTAKVRVQYLREETAALFPANSPASPENRTYAAVPVDGVSSVSLIPEANASVLPPKNNTPVPRYANRINTPEKNSPAKKSSSKIFVQAGAFSIKDKAEKSADRLSSLGNVDVVKINVNGKNLYKVRVGPLESSKSADRLLGKVENYGFKDAFIITD